MKLLTKQILKEFQRVGNQDSENDPVVIVKFFNPTGAGHWYVTEFNPDTEVFFGYVSILGGPNDEFGLFSLKELESYEGHMGLGIERDLYFTAKPLSKCGIDSFTPIMDALACDNVDCHGNCQDIRPVKMKEIFEGGIVNWCRACRKKDSEFIAE